MEKQAQEAHSVKSAHSMAPTHTAKRQSRLFSKHSNKKIWWVSGIIIIIVALLVSGLLYTFRSQIDSSKYQAVFLTNGQVYFGKLKDYYTERPYLTDVYYIQAQDGTGAGGAQASASSDQQLVKLGSEVHAPENTMILNKSSILFVENLTGEGKVVQLIQQNQKEDK